MHFKMIINKFGGQSVHFEQNRCVNLTKSVEKCWQMAQKRKIIAILSFFFFSKVKLCLQNHRTRTEFVFSRLYNIVGNITIQTSQERKIEASDVDLYRVIFAALQLYLSVSKL